MPEYNLKDNISIYSEENLGKLEKDFKDFKLQDGVSENIKEACVKRFENEKSQLHDHKTEKGYAEDQLDKDPTGLRVKFFRRTLIPVLLNPKDEELKKPEPFKIDYSRNDMKLEKGASIKDRSKWQNVFDGNEIGYFQKLIDQYEEERKKLHKKSNKNKDDDFDSYGGYGENALGKAEDEFHIASENFVDDKKILNKEDDENDKDINNIENDEIIEFDKIKIDFDDGIISETGLEELSKIVDYVNKILLSEKSGFNGFLKKAGYNIEKGWNFLSSSKFSNWFRSEEKIKNTYLPPIDGIGRFLDKNKENLTNFITERRDYLDNIVNKQDDKIFQKEYNQKSMGLLRVKKYATMMLMNIIKESINLSRYKEKDREKYINNELSILLFKIYKKAQEDYDKLKSEHDTVSKNDSESYKYEDEEENKDDEKKEENEKQNNDIAFSGWYYLRMFEDEKISNYLCNRVKIQLVKIFLKTNFFGFDIPCDDEKTEKEFDFKKKQIINMIDKQINLKYSVQEICDTLNSNKKNESEYLDNYFDIMNENLKKILGHFNTLGKKWLKDDNNLALTEAQKMRVKDFPIGTSFESNTEKIYLYNKIKMNNYYSPRDIYGYCLSFNKNDFDKALKKAEEIRAIYGIS